MANKATIENLIRLKCAIDTHTPQRMLALDSQSAYDIVISLDAAIEALSADRWIPCSERLPQIEREGQRRGWYLTTNGYGCVSLTQYEFYHDFLKTGWQSDIQIIAWMPLPEAYKGGK